MPWCEAVQPHCWHDTLLECEALLRPGAVHACCCRGLASNMGVQNFSSAQQWRGIAVEALERRRWAIRMLVL